MAFETFPRSTPQEEQQNTESRFSLEKKYFNEIINTKIIDSYEKELEKLGFTNEQLIQFEQKVLDISPDNRERLFAFPWELKQRFLPTYIEKIKKGTGSIEDMVDKIVEVSTSQHRKVAYHTSNQNILPKEERLGNVKDMMWKISGTEEDHRDGNLPMAYYSYDYENLYRVKNPKFLYMVSIQEHQNSGHKKDGNQQWGRASTLPVIEKIDFKEVQSIVQELVDENKNGQSKD